MNSHLPVAKKTIWVWRTIVLVGTVLACATASATIGFAPWPLTAGLIIGLVLEQVVERRLKGTISKTAARWAFRITFICLVIATLVMKSLR
jgi:hypothetical protein